MTERAAFGGPFLCPARTSTDALYVSARADVGIRPYVQFSGGLFVGGDAHIAPPRPQVRNSRPRQIPLVLPAKVVYNTLYYYAPVCTDVAFAVLFPQKGSPI